MEIGELITSFRKARTSSGMPLSLVRRPTNSKNRRLRRDSELISQPGCSIHPLRRAVKREASTPLQLPDRNHRSIQICESKAIAFSRTLWLTHTTRWAKRQARRSA